MKGLYSLEDYYAQNLNAYYRALTVGPSHNYYQGRAESDIADWVAYFCQGTADSFESVRRRAQEAAGAGARDWPKALRQLDPRQRKALELFRGSDVINSHDIEVLFGISQRAARNLLAAWVEAGLILAVDPAKKTRRYRLAEQFTGLLS